MTFNMQNFLKSTTTQAGQLAKEYFIKGVEFKTKGHLLWPQYATRLLTSYFLPPAGSGTLLLPTPNLTPA